MTYTQTQWLLIFYFYCVAGWIWESCYVSCCQRHWVNRGFLHGPWLPIYGTGAIVILFTTMPVNSSIPLIFLVGMVSATALEYVTGAVMERIFHMRYWDYSSKRCNLNGYICLSSSVAWGGFSLLLVRVLHPPVDTLIRALSGYVPDILSFLLTVLFTVDTTRSIQSALNLKELMKKLTENSEAVSRINSRLSSLSEKLEERSDQFRQRMKELESTRGGFAQQSGETALSPKERWQRRLAEYRERQSGILSTAREKAAAALAEVEQRMQKAPSEQERSRLESIRSALKELHSTIRASEIENAARRNLDYQRAVSILERNPSARSKKYQKAFSDLKELVHERRQKHSK